MSNCSICNDTGVTKLRRPMRWSDGAIKMIVEPQLCQCEAGTLNAYKYEENLKEGRAGMHGIYPISPGA